jgi:hypothetical protein
VSIDAYAARAVIVGRAVRNVLTDFTYGHIMAAGPDNSDYLALEEMFAGRVRDGDVLVDVGCGRGRVLAKWLRRYPGHQVIGIELNEQRAAKTRRRFRREARCTVISGDAIASLPENATLLFLFNPFDRDGSLRMRDALANRPPVQPPLRLLYTNPEFVDQFENNPDWITERVPIGSSELVPHHDLVVIDRRHGANGQDPVLRRTQ